MVTYHYVKIYVSIIIQLEVITLMYEILSCSSWDLPWTSSWFAERKEKNKNNNNKKRSKNNKSPNVVWET